MPQSKYINYDYNFSKPIIVYKSSVLIRIIFTNSYYDFKYFQYKNTIVYHLNKYLVVKKRQLIFRFFPTYGLGKNHNKVKITNTFNKLYVKYTYLMHINKSG